jgi:hypothetical protein
LSPVLRRRDLNHKKYYILIYNPTARPADLLRFIYLDPFVGQAGRLRITEEALRILELTIMVSPTAAKVIAGTNGVRKLRFSAPESNQGKSSSYRVFYAYLAEYSVVLLWAIIAKSDEANLTKADRNALAQEMTRAKALFEKGIVR